MAGTVHDSIVVTGNRSKIVVTATGDSAPRFSRRLWTEKAAAKALFTPPIVLEGSRPTSWLHPMADILPVQKRPEVDDLVAAYRLRSTTRVRLVCGRGGQGKSHLAREVCARLRAEGWLAGAVNLGGFDSADGGHPNDRLSRLLDTLQSRPIRNLDRQGRGRRGVLLVVDYAENQTVPLRALLSQLIPSPSVRVLLLARYESGWWRELLDDPQLSAIIHPHPMFLASLGEQRQEQVAEVHAEAMRCFAKRLDLGPRQENLIGAAGLRGRAFGTTLDMYADALLKMLSLATDERPATGAGGDNVLGNLLVHERRYVNTCLLAEGITLSDHQRDAVLAAVFLVPATSTDEAIRALRALFPPEELPDGSLVKVASVLSRLYPGELGQFWAPPQPDRMPDTHVLDMAERCARREEWVQIVTALCAGLDARHARASARVLIRALSTPGAERNYPIGLRRIREAITQLIKVNPRGYVEPATLLAPAVFSSAISEVLARPPGPRGLSDDETRGLDTLLLQIGFTVARAEIAAVVSRRLVRAKQRADAENAADADVAAAVGGLALRLAAVGQPHKAIRTARQAAELYRRLTHDDPARHLADHAAALNNLALRLAAVGQPHKAIRAARQATALYRRLTHDDPARHLADHAAALNNLAIHLGACGHRQEGLRAVQTSWEIYGRLYNPAADADPSLVLIPAELAREFLVAPGDLVDPSDTTRSAPALWTVDTHIELNQAGADMQKPPGYQAELACALHTLALRLAAVGRIERALALTTQAVNAFHRLVDAHPDSYRPGLAAALNTEAQLHLHRNELAEAAQVSNQALTIFHRLVATSPDAYEPDLVRCLLAHATILHKIGELDHVRTTLLDAARRVDRFAVSLPRRYRVVQERIRARLQELAAHSIHPERKAPWNSTPPRSSTPSGRT